MQPNGAASSLSGMKLKRHNINNLNQPTTNQPTKNNLSETEQN